MEKTCFHCKAEAAELRNGWRLTFGGFAQLCNECAAAYEDGSFCEMYHLDATGWRSCDRCEKPLHCGCIMSEHTYTLLDIEGVRCILCVSDESIADIAVACLSDDSPATGLSVGVINLPPGTFQGEHQTGTTHIPATRASHGETEGQVSPHALMLLGVEQLTEPRIANQQRHGDVPEKVMADRDCLNGITEEKTQEHSIISNCRKLFEHVLSQVDVDRRKGHLAISTKHAEEHFPQILRSKEVLLNVWDIKGNDWEFKLRLRPKKRSKYVLDGIKDCKLLMQWQVGDIVTFYIRETQGKFIIGLTKAQDVPKIKMA